MLQRTCVDSAAGCASVSGARKAGVPFRGPSQEALASDQVSALPKSASLTRRSPPMSRLAGFRSPWMTLCSAK